MTGLAAELRLAPFAHTTAIQVIPTDLANEALRWMESEAPWSLRVADFYEQWELHLEPGDLPRSLLPLLAPPTVDNLKRAMLGPISDDDLELTEVTAHKLVAGQTIRIHNDYVEGHESHRLLIQLNRGWSDAQGGLLMLFGSPRADDVRRLVRPLHASALAFKISANSFHAVSSIQSGERFTLVYSFKTCNHVLSAMNDAGIPWVLDVAPLRLPLAVGHGWLSGRISSPPLLLRSELEARGFRFRGDGTGSAPLVDAAAGWIGTAPTLEAIAATVVLNMHLLIADPGYDTSHSEPRWRSTIFVSIPERSDGVGALRLAESIIHEAMHLHLTNAEAFAPLVKDFQGQCDRTAPPDGSISFRSPSTAWPR